LQTDYDDANVPSLLSIPLLGYPYDQEVYRATRKRILSSKNPLFFTGTHLKGIGSAHTRAGQVWPLALMVQGLTATAAQERAEMLQLLLKTQCSNGLMHESVNANNLSSCSREWFGWANALLVALVESGLGIDCGKAAEAQHMLNVAAREQSGPSDPPRNGGPQDPAYFVSLLSTIAYDLETLTVPAYIGQHAKAM
jgi:meiotically up-regulated gene 157 (Mug157) protein